MKKYKATFNVTTVASIKNTFIDDEMWAEFKSENLEEAEYSAIPSLLSSLLDKGRIVTKLELIKIEEDGKVLKRYLKSEGRTEVF